MRGVKSIARKWSTGTVSKCLKHNNVGKLIVYVSNEDKGDENKFDG